MTSFEVHSDGQLAFFDAGGLPFGHAVVCGCGSRSPVGAVVNGRWRCGDCLYHDAHLNVVERGDVRPFGRGRPPLMQR